MKDKIDKKWYENMSAAEYLSARGKIAGSVKSERKSKTSAANGLKHTGKKHETR